MSEHAIVKVKNLYKSFRLPHEKHNGIKQALIGFFRGKKGYEIQEVLKDISFDIHKGEFFGIVGRNGSGKSTLLKLLAGIYTPDKGAAHIAGTVTPFIELGVGFNPDLTGRDNVYLNAALLGMSRDEVDRIYDEIVSFAELHRFMDQKLKNYSSGMQVRLAFSIAIRANSDVLIMDEVLAVGDSEFQAKCYRYFKDIKENTEKTIILVTHDMAAVKKFCDRAAVINKGRVEYVGDPHEASARYQVINFPTHTDTTDGKSKLSISLSDEKDIYQTGDELQVILQWDDDLKGVKNAGVALTLQDGTYVYGTNTKVDNFSLGNQKSITYKVSLALGAGTYNVNAAVFGDSDEDIIYFSDKGPTFQVQDKGGEQGLTRLSHEWSQRNV